MISIVAPFTGAWIEIYSDLYTNSLGLVAPFTGAWIEICYCQLSTLPIVVAPFTGAWIEIEGGARQIQNVVKSHPSRVRGLKYIMLNQ